MTLDELINKLKSNLLQELSLETLCYFYINNMLDEIDKLDKSNFDGEVEQITAQSFLKEHADIDTLEIIEKRLKNSLYKKGLNVYHFMGLSLQDRLNDTQRFERYLNQKFNNHSFRYKYLIAKCFNHFEDDLKARLKAEEKNKNRFISVLKALYLESSINRNQIINKFEEEIESLDLIDLLLLEDLQKINAIGYNKLHKKLFDDILWIVGEIQSKHKTFNNNEDQYNSMIQSLLNAKNYICEPQTQRGESPSKIQSGELDIAIFSKKGIPLSILEAFVINSIDKRYISAHLKKLTENYDPNGLRSNYAVIYAKHKKFEGLWKGYKDFVRIVNFEHVLISNQLEDITDRHPKFAGIKIGLTDHNNRGSKVRVYHIFMDMNF